MKGGEWNAIRATFIRTGSSPYELITGRTIMSDKAPPFDG